MSSAPGVRRAVGTILVGVALLGVALVGCSSSTETAVPSGSTNPPGSVARTTPTLPGTSGTSGTSGTPGTSVTEGTPTSVTGSVPAGASTTTSSPSGPGASLPVSSTRILPSTTTASPVTSVAPASSVPVPQPGVTTAPVPLETQLFWVRPPQEDRAIDIPGYRDPADGTRPLVVYGSVRNAGDRAVSDPTVQATWVDESGAPVGSFSAPVLRADSTTPASTLSPGASGDVIIVVTDPAIAARLGASGLVPQLVAAGR